MASDPAVRVINTGVANMYREPAFASEVVSQALLGEAPDIIDRQGKWFKVRQWDNYEGWVYYFYLTKNENYLAADSQLLITESVAEVKSAPDPRSDTLRDAVYGSRLPVNGRTGGWVEVALPDGKRGWVVEQPSQGSGPARQRLSAIARQFLGAPYMWGGKSIRGFDCSGYVQTIYKGVGVELPRDAHQQHRFDDLPDIAPEKAQPGDLFFFAESGDRVTHVTMSLGGAEFIHASGWIKIESLDKDADHFNHLLKGIFTVGKDMTRLLDAA